MRIYAEELEALHDAGGTDLYIDLINRIVRARPPGMTIGVHMCRGNAMGRWMAAGGYERIAERTFNTLKVDAYFLEYDSERAGGFEPLRFMPKGTKVVLGLVSTKTALLEEPDDLRRKIAQAARFVAPQEGHGADVRAAGGEAQAGGGDGARGVGRSVTARTRFLRCPCLESATRG